MENPISSYLLAGHRKIQKFVKRSRSGIPLELYIEEIDQDKWETSYQNSIQILTFGETNR
jgi:hypothetical protein